MLSNPCDFPFLTFFIAASTSVFIIGGAQLSASMSSSFSILILFGISFFVYSYSMYSIHLSYILLFSVNCIPFLFSTLIHPLELFFIGAQFLHNFVCCFAVTSMNKFLNFSIFTVNPFFFCLIGNSS